MFKKMFSAALALCMALSAALPSAPFYGAVTQAYAAEYNSADANFSAKGGEWYYKKDTKGDLWNDAGFESSSDWTRGTAPLGYGYSDPAIATDIGRGDGVERFYVQKKVNVESLSGVNSFYMNIDADDAANIYINGKLVYEKVTNSDVNKDVTAVWPANPQGGSSGDVYLPADYLTAGNNIISVEVLNNSKTSSDIYFDMACGVSASQPTAGLPELPVEEDYNYDNLIITPGKNETEMNFAWYSEQTGEQESQYHIDEKYDSQYCIQKGQNNGGAFYFNDNNNTTIYKLPLLKDQQVKARVCVDVDADFTISFSTNGSDYVLMDQSDGVTGSGNRGWRSFAEDNELLNFENADELWVKIGDRTPESGNGGRIYGIVVTYLDLDGDNYGDMTTLGVLDSKVQIVKASELGSNGEFPEPNDENTFQGYVSSAVTGYNTNKVTVTGLEPETEYAYRISADSADGKWSRTYYTSTEPAGEEFSFIYVGDAQLGARNRVEDQKVWENTMELAEAKNPDAAFIMSAGDQVNTGSNESEYDSLTAAEQLQEIPFVPTIGNHDANDANWTYHYNVPNITTYGRTGAGTDYYYSYGDALFIVLNTNNGTISDHKQAVEQAISTHEDARWKIVMMHHDIYGSGMQHSLKTSMYNLRVGLSKVFDDNDIDVVLTGHDHSFTRSYMMYGNTAYKDEMSVTDNVLIDPAGTLYMTATSSSASKYYDLAPVRGSYVAKREQTYKPAYATVEISDNEFTINSYYTDDDSQPFDTFTIQKSATDDDLDKMIEKYEADEQAQSEQNDSLAQAAEDAKGKADDVKTEACKALYDVLTSTKNPPNDEAFITSFSAAGADAEITEVETYGEKQPNGSYKYDHEILNFTQTIPVSGTVTLKVPQGTDRSNLDPQITYSEGARAYVLADGEEIDPKDADYSKKQRIFVYSERGNYNMYYDVTVRETVKNGFVLENGVEYYYENGVLQTNKAVTVGGVEYYLSSLGTKLIKAIAPNGRIYGADGALYTDGSIEIGGKIYYATSSGTPLKNSYQTVGGRKVYFKADGTMAVNEVVLVGNQYICFGTAGTVSLSGLKTIGSKTYYVKSNGVIAADTVMTVNGVLMAFDAAGVRITGSTAAVIGGKTYIVKSGTVQKGSGGNKLVTLNGKSYIVSSSGYVRKLSRNAVFKAGSKSYLVNSAGEVVKPSKNKVYKVSGKSYVISKKGIVQKASSGNKLVTAGKYSYIVNSKGIIQKGSKNKLVKVKTKSYVVNKNGRVQKAKRGYLPVKAGGRTYLVDKKGAAATSGSKKSKIIKSTKGRYRVDKKGVAKKVKAK